MTIQEYRAEKAQSDSQEELRDLAEGDYDDE